jgi:hypothetical protein
MDVPSGTDESRERPQCSPWIGEVVEDPNSQNQVERLVCKRQLLCVSLHGDDVARKVASCHVNRVTDVDCDHSSAEAMSFVAVPPGTGADVQHQTPLE